MREFYVNTAFFHSEELELLLPSGLNSLMHKFEEVQAAKSLEVIFSLLSFLLQRMSFNATTRLL